MNDFFLYIKESYNELVHNVTWPTWSELTSNAVLVIVASIIFALVVFGLDTVSNQSLKFIYSLASNK
ncbi:MAG: preprotein translocase subunit SecE [Saprospiraceae bacterium]|jgi:preprotein translocase subunit SecE|tara:strand:+ start:1748 stop:1948 length:201 start_codon:yes stop_codon:yes gene_type:complete